MRELLIRYLLGELEPHEHDAVQQQLAESTELRRELAQLRSCFANARHDDDPDEPPRGLAERTATWVSESDSYDALPPSRPALSDASDAPSGVLGWSLADLTVAGGVMLAVSMLLFPALRDSRDGTRRSGCLFNLSQIGQLFQRYAESNGGYAPEVLPDENAGIYVVRIAERGLIDEDDFARILVCPGSRYGELMRAGQFSVPILTQRQLAMMSPEELATARMLMSPDYAYRFGFRLGNQYHFIRIGSRTPILCDAPSTDLGNMSANHGGSVVQVLFADGSVAVLTSGKLQGGRDDLFCNLEGKVAAGVGGNDSVLAPSHATPGIFFAEADGSGHRLQQLQRLRAIRNLHPAFED
jgi:prepilin-type processing-associated H-X9-DG protein